MPDKPSFPGMKRWRGLWVDEALKDSWLRRLNALPMLKILGTCAGHPKEPCWTEKWPAVSFRVEDERLLDTVVCALARVRFSLLSVSVSARLSLGGSKYRPQYCIHVHHPTNDPPYQEARATRRWWLQVIRTLEQIQKKEKP